MKKEHIPYRQIHLDFHTSKYIEGIGDKFDAGEFVQTLKEAHVNSINLFTKCHHGMYYYPTKIGTMHPHLKFDLFGAQIKACRKNNIRVLAYTCVAWNEDWADRHPEWMVIDHRGVIGGREPFSNAKTTWHSLCINNPDYKHLLKEELKEVYEAYHPDGFWIDIVLGKTCICAHCMKEMKEMGLNPEVLNDIKRHDALSEIKFCKEFYGYLKEMDSSLEIYFNCHPYQLDDGEDEAVSSIEKRKYFSFLDIESLPSEEWGYTHFPVAVNYINKFQQEYAMMNGKFHGSWGDFGSLRNIEAMEYEAFRAVANGAKICTGDQLHPSGCLDKTVYERIGRIFASIEEKEPWLEGTGKLAETAVLIPPTQQNQDEEQNHIIEEGAYRILSELHIPFDFINIREDFAKYKLIILPDSVRVSQNTAIKLNDYKKQGGKLLLTGKSGLAKDKDEFVIENMGCRYLREADYSMRYMRFTNACFEELPQIDHVLYCKGDKIECTDGTVLAEIVNPYFDRSYDRFCSHRQTPPVTESSREPAVIQTDDAIYISSPLFTDYEMNGAHIYKDILAVCIQRLCDNPLIRTDLPSITEVTLRKNENAIIVHLINYVIQRKCRLLDTIEEKYVVTDRNISVRTGFVPGFVRTVPGAETLSFSYENGYVHIPILKALGHTMIEIHR